MATSSRPAGCLAGAAEVPEPDAPESDAVAPVSGPEGEPGAPVLSVLDPVLEKPQVCRVPSLHGEGRGMAQGTWAGVA